MGNQWDANIAMTEALAGRLMIDQFPELAPIEVQTLDAGWDNVVLLVNGAYVFRFPRREIAAPLIEMENRLLPWLSSQVNGRIPNPCFIGQPTDDYPFAFSGYPILKGHPPHQLRLSDDVRVQAAQGLAEFLKQLHDVPPGEAIHHGISPSDSIGRMNLTKRVPQFIAKVQEAHAKGLIDNPDDLTNILNHLSSPQFVGECRSVVHGDLNFRNFLVGNDGGLTGVIDWGDAHIGHPAVDLSVVFSYLPVKARERFWNVYGSVPQETLDLARFRAIYTNLVILIYADDIGDKAQCQEAKRALENVRC